MSETKPGRESKEAKVDRRPVMDASGDAAGADPRDMERDLRVFHLRSPRGAEGGAREFVPATLWRDVGAGVAGRWDPEPVRDACATLLGAAPEDDIPFADPESAALRMFLRAAKVRSQERRDAFQRRISDLSRQLGELLEVDRAKREARSPENLAGSMGAGISNLLDTGALAKSLGDWRGSASLDPDRRERLEEVVRQLESFSWADTPHVVVVHDQSMTEPLPGEARGWAEEIREAPSADAPAVFDEYAQRFSGIFGAVRVATLEAAGRFDPERHGPWVEQLEPSAYSRDERQLVPIVVACDRAGRVAARNLPSFTKFLLCERPVHLVLRAEGVPAGSLAGDDAADGAEVELGYLAVAHRNAFVQQSSLGTPEHLLAGMLRGFDHMRPALHVVLVDPGSAAPSEAGFHAALHARVHPHFRYDPQAGTTWAGRMDFSGNPASDEDWPDNVVEFDRANGQDGMFMLPLTLADWALLRPELAGEFRPVPAGCATEMLTELGSYLELDAEEAIERIPYIWGVDASARMRRLAVTRRMALACRERLDFWHTLQELAGIRSEYVLEAVRRTRAELEAQAAEERQKMAEVHAAELAEARREAVGEAMQTLSNRLLDLDLSAPLVGPSAGGVAGSKAPTTSTPMDTVAPPPSAAEANGDLEAVSDEPWIDTPLCTSCNDCIDVNSILFTYDGNKQAIIGDPTGGTYAQMVLAAEKCPARCIHPGQPLNADEPDLKDLLRRANPFQ